MVLRTSLNKTRIMFGAFGSKKNLLRVAWSVDRKIPSIFCENTPPPILLVRGVMSTLSSLRSSQTVQPSTFERKQLVWCRINNKILVDYTKCVLNIWGRNDPA